MEVRIYNPAYEEPIEGFETIEFSGDFPSLFSKLDEICCDSEAEVILAQQLLSESAQGVGMENLIGKLLSKVRTGGRATFGGVDIDAFADAVKANDIDDTALSLVVNRCRSMSRAFELSEMISKAVPQYFCSWIVRGINYEITCARP